MLLMISMGEGKGGKKVAPHVDFIEEAVKILHSRY